MNIQSTVSGIAAILLLHLSCCSARLWDFEPMFVNTTSADESLVQIHAEIVRKGRETPSISGTLDCQYPLDETTLVEAVVYRSQTGSEDDYKLTPWGIPRKTFTEYMREYYNNMIYPNFEGCSNLAKPGTENAWSKVNYVFDECIPTGKGLPEIVPEGIIRFNLLPLAELNGALYSS